MALAAGLHGSVRLSFCRAGKIDQFGVNFKVKIIVDNDVVRPFKKLQGKVVVETRFPIKHKGILIQFEGLCTLRYSSKLDNRTTFHQGRQCILEGSKPESDGYQESPIRYVIVTELPEGTGSYTINPETVTYPFTLEIPGDPHLPAPFKNPLGSLVYRLVVYMKSASKIQTEVGEKIMRFTGHLNLFDNVEANKSIVIEQFYKRSVFSRKKLVEATFSVESSGFLPNDIIEFVLYVKNPKCFPLEMVAKVLLELKYDATGRRDSPKKKYIIVASREKDEFEPQPETTWIDGLAIRENQEPSFCAHFMYNVSYILQFKVKILDQGTIKGEAPIYIGTTREPLQSLMSSAGGLEVPFVGLRRRGSASSAHSVRSHNSTTTTYSLPPAYSQLSSRIPSIETLPPAYDEVEMEDQGMRLEVPTPSPTYKECLLDQDGIDTPDEEED